jgi:hypothetical protein
MNVDFKNVRVEAKRRLEVYKSIIDVFRHDVPQYNFNPCILCELGKTHGFIEDDIKKTCSEMCTFRVTCNYILPYATNYEPHLYGKYLDQMIELNGYVITTSSTNEPHDDKFQNMFIEIYCEESMIEKIIKFCKDEGYYYTCIYNKKMGDFNIDSKRKDFITTEIAESKELLYDFPGTYGKVDDNYFIDKLAFITIEDGNIENRDLYAKLNNMFKKL